MKNIVFLNSAKIDFDNKLDFALLEKGANLTVYDESTAKEILERVKDQEILITKELPVGRELIEKFPDSVKLICEAGTGYNNIDIVAAKERGIGVCNVPGYSTEAVAQLVMTFILNLSSSMTLQQSMIKEKNFSNFTSHLQVPHFELQNKTLGIVGAGSIGQGVMKLALAFGMKVLVNSRTPKTFDNPNAKFVSFEELLKNSDFITLHSPLTENTKYLICKETLSLMKPTAFIINTSRGAIIKETDLIDALRNGQIAGAALDVQDPEPPSLDNPLFYMDNVILTPHIGWKCFESRQRLVELLAKNIEAFIEGNPINVVN